jgi:hypothetical protein
MSDSKEAVVFVHGFYLGKERDFFLNSFAAGFTEQLENIKVEELGEVKIAGNVGRSFQFHLDETHVRVVDVYDAYWADLIDKKLSEDSLKNRVFRGIYLLFYWFFTKNWLAIKDSPPLLIGLGIALLLWIFWYYGTIAVAFVAIGQDPDALGFPLPEGWSDSISSLGKQMGGLPVWLILSGLLSFIPINIYADVADFTTRYLDDSSEGKVIRAKIRKRVSDTLNNVLNDNSYNKITVVAHSFGVVVATDILADYHQSKPIQYITLGSALKFLVHKSRWIEKEIHKCLNNETIKSWIDFYSDQDWLCTKVPIPKGSSSEKIKHKKNKLKFSLLKQLNGKSHDHYFTDEDVLKTILNPNLDY